MYDKPVLAFDMGATKVFGGFATVGPAGEVQILESTQFDVWPNPGSFTELLRKRAASGLGRSLRNVGRVAVGGPGDIENRTFVLPDSLPCPMDIGEAEKAFGWENTEVLNDTSAQAYYLQLPPQARIADPVITVAKEDIAMDKGGTAIAAVGSGLGVAAWTVENGLVRSEAGNVTIPGDVPDDTDVQEFLSRFRERVPPGKRRRETIISGGGLALTYNCVNNLSGDAEISPKGVTEILTDDPKTIGIWSLFLGMTIRDIICEFWPTQGFYLFGGVLERNPELLDPGCGSRLLEGMLFMEKHRDVVSRIPVFHIRDEFAALKGLALAAVRADNGKVRRQSGAEARGAAV